MSDKNQVTLLLGSLADLSEVAHNLDTTSLDEILNRHWPSPEENPLVSMETPDHSKTKFHNVLYAICTNPNLSSKWAREIFYYMINWEINYKRLENLENPSKVSTIRRHIQNMRAIVNILKNGKLEQPELNVAVSYVLKTSSGLSLPEYINDLKELFACDPELPQKWPVYIGSLRELFLNSSRREEGHILVVENRIVAVLDVLYKEYFPEQIHGDILQYYQAVIRTISEDNFKKYLRCLEDSHQEVKPLSPRQYNVQRELRSILAKEVEKKGLQAYQYLIQN